LLENLRDSFLDYFSKKFLVKTNLFQVRGLTRLLERVKLIVEKEIRIFFLATLEIKNKILSIDKQARNKI